MAQAMHPENFPLQGESFEALDRRSRGRVIRLVSFATLLGYEWPNHYRYVVVANPLNPAREGKQGTISGKTLGRVSSWFKVSHN